MLIEIITNELESRGWAGWRLIPGEISSFDWVPGENAVTAGPDAVVFVYEFNTWQPSQTLMQGTFHLSSRSKEFKYDRNNCRVVLLQTFAGIACQSTQVICFDHKVNITEVTSSVHYSHIKYIIAQPQQLSNAEPAKVSGS